MAADILLWTLDGRLVRVQRNPEIRVLRRVRYPTLQPARWRFGFEDSGEEAGAADGDPRGCEGCGRERGPSPR